MSNQRLAEHTFVLQLDGCGGLAGTQPGQFVMLRARRWGTDPLLPRAFSLLDVGSNGRVEILVKGNRKGRTAA